MTYRTRLLSVCAVLAVLLALLVLGLILSPERIQARTAGMPLLPGVSPAKIDVIEISAGGRAILLRRSQAGWETPSGPRAYPVSADRVNLFLRTVSGLKRSSLVSRDAGHLAELGLSTEAARVLVLRRGGAPGAALLVGKRGPGGDSDYVQVRGESAVYLARGSLAFFLAQAQPYWYELHVLPEDVQPDTIASITVNGSLAVDGAVGGSLRGGYTLDRPSADRLDQWQIGRGAGAQPVPADRVTAGSMASSLALLEGTDFAEPGAPVEPGGAGRLDIVVTTFQGKRYSLMARPAPEPGMLWITTDWSPWTYVVSGLALLRAVLPAGSLASR